MVAKRVEVDANGCWLWQGAVKGNGYGNVNIDGRTLMAHRVAYELHVGPIPDGQRVLHGCDVRRCVNPAHLHLGSAADNSREMVERGRHRPGTVKLTPEQRGEIRDLVASGWKQQEVADRYGVAQTTVSDICTGRCKAVAP